MRCPICRKATFWKDNPHRPFCSERCKLIDLDNWLSERYRVSTPVAAPDRAHPEEGSPRDAKEERG